MSELTRPELRKLVKEAVSETLSEQRDLLYDLFSEVIEDHALGQAIREGLQTETVSRDEVMRLTENGE